MKFFYGTLINLVISFMPAQIKFILGHQSICRIHCLNHQHYTHKYTNFSFSWLIFSGITL